jgi:5-methylcytosine-specific restriction enzyme A
VFEVGRVYRRRDLHERFGGQRQGGIVTPAGEPFIFVITGEGGEEHGYADGWDQDGTFRYYGEGQVGDMQFVRGNAAIRDHAELGKDLHLFEKVAPAHLRYLGQMVCAGYDLVPNSPDRVGNLRTAIVFQLVSLSDSPPLDEQNSEGAPGEGALPASWYWEQPLEDLREAATAAPAVDATARDARRAVYHRSEAVRVYVLRRADGLCEACAEPAPFTTTAGRPYLEPHHTRRISDGGPDDPAWVVAVCPNCHRRAHYGEDNVAFNQHLSEIARSRDLEDTTVQGDAAPTDALLDPLLAIPPPIGYACNVYRRRFGAWPTRLRMHPGFAAGFLGNLESEALTQLATTFEIEVTASEPSPRVTVIGEAGAVTYDEGVEEQDWDTAAFLAFVGARQQEPAAARNV